MRVSDRLFDICVAGVSLLLTWPIIILCMICIAICDRHPPIFGARRMKGANQPFTMWKLRTMRGSDDGLPTSASKASEITRLGFVLRQLRLDELPQLLNVLKGDMRIVGTRPPTPRMVCQYPDRFETILRDLPGITGDGTLKTRILERRLLDHTSTVPAVETVYVDHILRQRVSIDLAYARKRTAVSDIFIVLQTLRMILSFSTMFRPKNARIWARLPTQ
ncbi:sugar transferase [Marivita sp. S0852]|uniref:sugar transferase n=1 Tax=Marivita sp. S0852 TaxID=3373893 RepID=UPI003982D188